MAMSQPKAQAPYVPGQKEPGELVDEQQSSGGSGAQRVSGDDEVKGGKGKDGREKQQGDYYTPVATEVVKKGNSGGRLPSKELDGNREGAEMNDLYSPEAGVDIVTSNQQSTPQNKSKGDEQEQRGEVSGSGGSGSSLVEAGKGMANDVSETLMSVRGRVMEKLSVLQLPSESLDAVRRTFETGLKGAYTTTRDAVQRTKQSLLDLFPSSNATEARKVVEEMEKEILANSEGSGEDMSLVSGGPEVNNPAPPTSDTSRPQFMRAKL